ncbi:MAG TPA: DNA repair protein RecO [Alphaproteobacteria bacterium]|nr:DNA repair protein RecO [Alphaproteobacteria bacterium]
MEWTDDGIVLSARRHGESAAIVQLLTRAHGRHAGLVHGGGSAKARAVLQPGNRVQVVWRARLAEHLGSFACELVRSGGAGLLDDPLRLAALAASAALAESALAEREPHPAVFDGLEALIAALAASDRVAGWGRAQIAWELGILAELGFGLDLSSCAATGESEALAYVSPRTGRAVSRTAGEPYKERLLPLPRFLAEAGVAPGEGDIVDGLSLTGYFLERHVFASLNRALPQARVHLIDRLRRAHSRNATPAVPAAAASSATSD